MFSKRKEEKKSASGNTSSSFTQNFESKQTNGNRTEVSSFSQSVHTTTTYIKTEKQTVTRTTGSSLALPSHQMQPLSLNSTTFTNTKLQENRPNLSLNWPKSSAVSTFSKTPQSDARPIAGTTGTGSKYVFTVPAVSSTHNSTVSPSPNIPYRSPYFNREFRAYSSVQLPSQEPEPLHTSTVSLPNAGEVVRDPRIPTYDTEGKKRGKVLIINNVKFLNKENKERTGAEKDEKDLTKLFKDFGFVVEPCRNLKSSEMKSKISKFKNDKSLKNFDICVVILMSHGNNFNKDGKRVPGGYTEIYGIDNMGVSIDSILNEFSTEQCPNLVGKPKIFIIQCCRGDGEERIARDAAPIRPQIKCHADTLVAYSTLPGFASNRDPEHGSWYIQSICDAFRKYAKLFHVEEMLKVVDEALSKKHPDYKQTSTYESRGFKRCYFNPK